MGNNSLQAQSSTQTSQYPNFRQTKRQQHQILGQIKYLTNKTEHLNVISIQKVFISDSDFQQTQKKLSKRVGTSVKKDRSSQNQLLSLRSSQSSLNRYIIQILNIQTQQLSQICGRSYKLSIAIEQFTNDLQKIMYEKQRRQEPFQEVELFKIILCVVNSLIALYDNNIQSFHLSLDSIVCIKGVYKIIDSQISNRLSPFETLCSQGAVRKGSYLSPQILQSSKNQFLASASPKNDIFTLGVLILSLARMENMDILYDYKNKNIDMVKLKKEVNSCSIGYSQHLKNILLLMLIQDPMQRIGLLSLKQLAENPNKIQRVASIHFDQIAGLQKSESKNASFMKQKKKEDFISLGCQSCHIREKSMLSRSIASHSKKSSLASSLLGYHPLNNRSSNKSGRITNKQSSASFNQKHLSFKEQPISFQRNSDRKQQFVVPIQTQNQNTIKNATASIQASVPVLCTQQQCNRPNIINDYALHSKNTFIPRSKEYLSYNDHYDDHHPYYYQQQQQFKSSSTIDHKSSQVTLVAPISQNLRARNKASASSVNDFINPTSEVKATAAVSSSLILEQKQKPYYHNSSQNQQDKQEVYKLNKQPSSSSNKNKNAKVKFLNTFKFNNNSNSKNSNTDKISHLWNKQHYGYQAHSQPQYQPQLQPSLSTTDRSFNRKDLDRTDRIRYCRDSQNNQLLTENQFNSYQHFEKKFVYKNQKKSPSKVNANFFKDNNKIQQTPPKIKKKNKTRDSMHSKENTDNSNIKPSKPIDQKIKAPFKMTMYPAQTPIKSLQMMQTIKKNKADQAERNLQGSGNELEPDIYKDGTNHFGRHQFTNGAIYEGEFNSKNEFQGNGTLFYPNGRVFYNGNWKRNKFHGFGTLYNDIGNQDVSDLPFQVNYVDFNKNHQKNWLYYEGEFIQDRKTGFGTLLFPNNDKFNGCFVNDAIDGFGTFERECQHKTITGIWKHNVLQQQ